MRLSDLTDGAGGALRSAGSVLADWTHPTVRLGVTGLARAGKTVFITALVRALTERAASPPFGRLGRLADFRAYIEPLSSFRLQRFAYEDHLGRLSGDPPEWPESTRTLSQLRLTLEWSADTGAFAALGLKHKLHIDILDYPGEWLMDLGMLGVPFADWSRDQLALARGRPTAKAFLDFLAGIDAGKPLSETLAGQGARLYAEYLQRTRAEDPTVTVLSPGRFLVMPADFEGSRLATFFPVERPATPARGSLATFLEANFEAYKTGIVQPFFATHFRSLDRQIVLIDVLTPLNAGPAALVNLEHGLDGVLRAFRHGSRPLLPFLQGRRVDRLMFAATKADLLHREGHARLAAILHKAVARAEDRAEGKGAAVEVTALAALRATEDVEKVGRDGSRIPCIRGVPAEGEKVAGRTFDGSRPAIIFPGDLPADPLDAFESERLKPGSLTFVRFKPPRLAASDGIGPAPAPHIGLDRVVDFLFGDYLP